ncbi:MAG TPA: dienelactone hydrolase family protein [Micromonosporaceae bacterium]|nr:dienelactone hydrolase family protein [Micromonosporaceae bacterium]
MADPVHLNPFVLPVETRAAERRGSVDLYLPEASHPSPAILFVHGGPVPVDLQPTPRDWPVFQAYASMAAARGLVGATVDHRLHALTEYATAADDVAAAVEFVRADPRVDGEQVAIWFFSGGGLLLADWLRASPVWLRCAAASYALLACPPEYGTRFNPADAVAEAGELPIVLTLVGRERPEIAATADAFVSAARACGARLQVVDVPNGQHGFDILDYTEESREAVERAMDMVVTEVTRDLPAAPRR